MFFDAGGLQTSFSHSPSILQTPFYLFHFFQGIGIIHLKLLIYGHALVESYPVHP